MKSNKRIIEEIKDLYYNHSKDHFWIANDTFTTNKKRVVDFCNLLLTEKIDIGWDCFSRCDTLDREVIKRMKEAGCQSIVLGIETGSQRMQKVINKNLDLKKTWSTLKEINEEGVRFGLLFIYGFPEEKKEDIDETLKFIYKASKFKNINNIELVRLNIYPKTGYYEKYFKELLKFNKKKLVIDKSRALNFQVSEEEIEKNPIIYSHFYNIKGTYQELGGLFDFFHNRFIISLAPFFSKTFQKIVKCFGNSPLDFYYEFIKNNPYFLKNQNYNKELQKFIENYDGKGSEWEDIRKIFRRELEKTSKFLISDTKKAEQKINDIRRQQKKLPEKVIGKIVSISDNRICLIDNKRAEKEYFKLSKKCLVVEILMREGDYHKIGLREIDISGLERRDEVIASFRKEKNNKICFLLEKITVGKI